MDQFTKEQALEFYESGIWGTWTPDQIVDLQLFQDRLCVPFNIFHKAIEQVLGRPVYTHEFAYPDSLRAEYAGFRPTPTMEQILDLIPKDKLIVLKLE